MGAPGRLLNILPEETPSTSFKDCTEFKVAGNMVAVRVVTSDGGGCGKLEFRAYTSHDDVDYYAIIDRDSIAEWETTIADTAGSYLLKLSGLTLPNNEYLKLAYKAENAAGKIEIDAMTYVDEGGSSMIEVGDIIADLTKLQEIATNTANTDTNTKHLEKTIATPASTHPARAIQVAGTDGTNARTLKTDTAGVIELPTGTAAMAGSTPVTIATDDPVTLALQALNNAITAITNSVRVQEVDPVHQQHQATVFYTNNAVEFAAGDTYLPDESGVPVADFKSNSFQLRAVAGQWDDGGTATDCVLNLYIEATNGLEHGGFVEWFDVGQITLDSAGDPWGSLESVGTAIARDLIDTNAMNFEKIRFRANYDIQPDAATPGDIVIVKRGRAV